jgi:DNA-binding GntR family transcriptional regulator
MKKDEVIVYIKDKIVRNVYKDGQRIVEANLCRQLNVGRSIVREALRHLEQEGYLEIIPNKGAVVKELTQKDIAQLYDLMAVLEGLSMRVATAKISNDDIKKIENIIDRMEKIKDDNILLFQENLEFHQFLTQLGGNTHLIAIMNGIREKAYRMGLQSFYSLGQAEASQDDHREILEAIKKRNPELVEELIRKHYTTSRDRLIKNIHKTL